MRGLGTIVGVAIGWMALVVAPCLPAAAQQGNRLAGFANRLAALEAAAARGPVPVIVRLDLDHTAAGAPLGPPAAAPSSAAEASARHGAIRDMRTRVLGRLGTSWRAGLKTFDSLPLVAMRLSRAGLAQLAADPEVLDIERDEINWPSLSSSIPAMRIDRVWSAGYTGAGQTVAILDTGVDTDHPFLGGRVVSEACYSSTDSLGARSLCPGGVASSTAPDSASDCALEGCDHGTHVAGIAAGNGPDFDGVARDANIIAIQVFSRFVCPVDGRMQPCIGAYDSDVIRGLERVHALRDRFSIAAANLSLGGGRFAGNCNNRSSLKLAIDRLRDAGIATVVPSGNDHFDGAVGSPGCISTAITVGSTDDRGAISGFSNHAPLVDLMAVGSEVRSSVPNGGFATFSGTSMAAPHVAGAWALLKEAGGGSVAQIEGCLESTGVGVSRAGVTVPWIDLEAAFACVGGARRVTVGMVVNVGSGLCLGGSGLDGALSLARCAAVADQQFDLADDGTLRLYGNRCLDAAPKGSGLRKNALVATVCDSAPEQAWRVDLASTARLINDNRACVAVAGGGQARGDALVVRGRQQCNGRSQALRFALIAPGLEVAQCFGGAGSDCARATDLPKASTGRRGSKGGQKMVVSVGTIAHDNCCRQDPNGYHCQGPDRAKNATSCRSEWLQAERDLRQGHVWKHTFGPYDSDHYSDDLATVAGRRLVLPADGGSKSGCDDPVVIASPTETVGTLAIAAPNGTKLDCTDEAFCASGNARRPAGKDFIVCAKPGQS